MMVDVRTTQSVAHRIAQLREEGVLDEVMIQYIERSLQPGGEKRIRPGESRADAVARLRRHFGWDERTAEFTISLSEGKSDLAPDEPMTEAEKRAMGIGVIAGDEEDLA